MTDAPQRPAALPLIPENVPAVLRETPRWVLWRFTLVERGQRKVWAKVPKQPNGRNAKSTDPTTWCTWDRALEAYGTGRFDGVGFIFDGTDDLVGVDLDDVREVDALDGTVQLSSAAQDALARLPGYWEVSPSGTGIKGWIRAEGVGAQKNDDLGIEVYDAGRYFAVTGHKCLESTDIGPFDNTAELNAWIDAHLGSVAPKRTQALVQVTGDPALDAFLEMSSTPQPLADWDADRIRRDIAPHLDLECHYEDWIKAGAALHHQFDGSEEGFELWDELYRDSPKYNGADYGRARWDSFHASRGGARVVTLGSLIKQTEAARNAAAPQAAAPPAPGPAAAGARAKVQARIDEFVKLINGVGDLHNLEQVARQRVAAYKELTDADRVLLVDEVMKKAASLGTRLPIAMARKWVTKGGGGTSGMPDIFDGWVFLTHEDRFYNLNDYRDPITVQAFDMQFNRYVPPGSVSDSAASMFKNVWNGDCLNRRLYAPPCEPLFEYNGYQCANSYNPASVPETAENAGVSSILDAHFRILLPDDRERRLLLAWMAHNVRHPGVLLGWAPYVYGKTEGSGKSAIGGVLRAAMGDANVGVVAVKGLGDKFSGWAADKAVNVIDEVKLHGANKYDVANALKPYLTERTVSVERKGRDAFSAPNYTNYLLTSNYETGLPINEADRRYGFFYVAMTREQMIALQLSGHYERLFDAIRGNPGAVRAWLLEQPIDPEVLAWRAPETAGRARVLAAVEPDFTVAARQVIEEGRAGVAPRAVIVSAIMRAVQEKLGYRVYTSACSEALEQLGFERFARNFKYAGKVETVWVKVGTSDLTNNEAVRAELDRANDPTEFDVL